MKPIPTLLAVSLAANLGLVALYFSRPSPPTGREQPRPSPSAKSRGEADSARRDALQAAIVSGDVAALEAAGMSPQAARELLLGRALFRTFERIRAARAAQPADDRWWRPSRANHPGVRELQLQNRREITDALVAAFGDDLGLFPGSDATAHLSFLPPEKRDALRRITQDYDEMMAKFSAGGGIPLPSDRERMKLLREERDRDIAALLTPAEREAYEMRTSPTAQNVRARYGDGIESAEDFRKIYALQKAFDEKFSMDLGRRVSAETMRERSEAQRQLQEGIRAALGEEKYAALRRASDPDLRTVDSLVARLNLPPVTAERVAASRETFAAESQRINANTALNPQQRRAQIQELGGRARAELTGTLGAEAAEAYAQHSPWLSMLQTGIAFTTSPTANTPMLGGPASVHPVPPPGGPGLERQSVTIAAPVGGVDAVPVDPVNGGGGLRVMTFAPGAARASTQVPPQRVMIAPKAPGSAPPPPQ